MIECNSVWVHEFYCWFRVMKLNSVKLQIVCLKGVNFFFMIYIVCFLSIDIKEFYEATLVAVLTDQKPVASNQFSAQMGRTSSETSIELINPEVSNSIISIRAK